MKNVVLWLGLGAIIGCVYRFIFPEAFPANGERLIIAILLCVICLLCVFMFEQFKINAKHGEEIIRIKRYLYRHGIELDDED